MLAAQIQNLNPIPVPPPTPTPTRKKKQRRGVVYDPALENEYLDEDVLAENAEIAAEAELASVTGEAKTLSDVLADALTVEVHALETSVVLSSSSAAAQAVRADAGAHVGHLDATTAAASSPSVDVTVEVFDVIVDVGEDD